MSCKTEELSIDLLERAGEVGFVRRPAPTSMGCKRSMLRGVGKCRSIMYAAHPYTQSRAWSSAGRRRQMLSSKPGSPTGPATCWAGNGALYTLLVSLGFPRLVGWVPCSLLHIYHRTMALCSSPVRRRVCR